MDTEQDSPLDLLSNLTKKYARGAEKGISESEVLWDALCLIPHCRFFYYEQDISKYLDLLYKLVKRSGNLSKIVEEIERRMNFSVRDQYLPYLDLLLILQIKLSIYDMLSYNTKAHINSMIQSNPLQLLTQVKRDRDNTPILREVYLNIFDYLICLSFEISNTNISTEVTALFDGVRDYLTQILYIESLDKPEYLKFYIKKMTKLIRCISLFLENGELYSDEFFKPNQVQIIFEKICPHFDNEEVSEAWLDLLYPIAMQDPTKIYVSYMPDSLLYTLHKGSNFIKDAFLKIVKYSQMKIFKHFLSKLTESNLKKVNFMRKVFLKGIMKLNSLKDNQVKKLLRDYTFLLKLDKFKSLPNYCFELLILLYKRCLVNEVDQNIMTYVQLFNNRLKVEIESMTAKRLCRAGDYILLLPTGPDSKELAKKWIQRMIHPEMLEKQDDHFYSLYTMLFVLGYSPANPEDQESLEISKREIKNLKDQIGNLFWIYNVINESPHSNLLKPIYDITRYAERKLEFGFETNDENFEDSKSLFRDFQKLLQEFVIKLQEVPTLNLSMTKTELNNIDEGTFYIKFNELVQSLQINRSNPILELMSLQMPSNEEYVDTRALFQPETVLNFFKSTLLWDGLIKILEYAFKYYDITNRSRRGTVLASICSWSDNLISIFNCSYLKYLNLSEIHDTTKAYIIHQIFLTSVNKIKSFTDMSSSIMNFIYIEPSKALEYDPSLNYVIQPYFLKYIAKICGTNLDENVIGQLQDRIFYGPLNSATDGRTLYGGYIILNQKYKARSPLSKSSSKLTLIHELAHLISRLEDNKYKYLIVSPKKQVKIEAAGERVPMVKSDSEAGNYLETQLFGFKLNFINRTTIRFLNKKKSWNTGIDLFKKRFRKCLNNKNEVKVHLQRYTPRGRVGGALGCVYRTRMRVSKPSLKADESNQ